MKKFDYRVLTFRLKHDEDTDALEDFEKALSEAGSEGFTFVTQRRISKRVFLVILMREVVKA